MSRSEALCLSLIDEDWFQGHVCDPGLIKPRIFCVGLSTWAQDLEIYIAIFCVTTSQNALVGFVESINMIETTAPQD